MGSSLVLQLLKTFMGTICFYTRRVYTEHFSSTDIELKGILKTQQIFNKTIMTSQLSVAR